MRVSLFLFVLYVAYATSKFTSSKVVDVYSGISSVITFYRNEIVVVFDVNNGVKGSTPSVAFYSTAGVLQDQIKLPYECTQALCSTTSQLISRQGTSIFLLLQDDSGSSHFLEVDLALRNASNMLGPVDVAPYNGFLSLDYPTVLFAMDNNLVAFNIETWVSSTPISTPYTSLDLTSAFVSAFASIYICAEKNQEYTYVEYANPSLKPLGATGIPCPGTNGSFAGYNYDQYLILTNSSSNAVAFLEIVQVSNSGLSKPKPASVTNEYSAAIGLSVSPNYAFLEITGGQGINDTIYQVQTLPGSTVEVLDSIDFPSNSAPVATWDSGVVSEELGVFVTGMTTPQGRALYFLSFNGEKN